MKNKILLLFGVNFFLRISTLFQTVVNIDEPQFAQFAHRIMAGDPPYTTMIGEKAFFQYLLYYVVLSLFGAFNLIAVHAVTILWVTATALTIYYILRRIVSEEQAFLGALLFSALTTMGEFKLISSNEETFANLPLCLSVLFFLKAVDSRRVKDFLITGFFIGLAGQFRHQSGIQLAVFGSYLAFYEPFFLKSKEERWKTFLENIKNILFILLPFLVWYAGVLLYLKSVGSFKSFSLWTFTHEMRYIRAGMENINVFQKGLVRTALMFLAGFAVWVTAGQTVRKQWRKKEVILFGLWFLWGFFAVSVGGRFSGRYFIQIFPPLALLAAVTASWGDWLSWKRWALLLPLFSFWLLRFFSPAIHQAIGELDYAPFQKKIGKYIAAHTKPDEKIYIWGWGNGIYFYAHRTSATRFINADFLTGRIPGSPTAKDPNFDTHFNIFPGSWDMFTYDLEKDRPVYIVDTAPANIHDYGKYPIDQFPVLKEYLQKNYKLETRLYKVDLYRRIAP